MLSIGVRCKGNLVAFVLVNLLSWLSNTIQFESISSYYIRRATSWKRSHVTLHVSPFSHFPSAIKGIGASEVACDSISLRRLHLGPLYAKKKSGKSLISAEFLDSLNADLGDVDGGNNVSQAIAVKEIDRDSEAGKGKVSGANKNSNSNTNKSGKSNKNDKRKQFISDELLGAIDSLDNESSDIIPVVSNSQSSGENSRSPAVSATSTTIQTESARIDSISSSQRPPNTDLDRDAPVSNMIPTVPATTASIHNSDIISSKVNRRMEETDNALEKESKEAVMVGDNIDIEGEKNENVDCLTKEQRMRRDRPPSRVKFAESSQPDFLMMGLEKVSLLYGNEVILKDSTFSVSTGERVGLVGPNGAGKTSQLKVLAGELEPTSGDVIKSSKSIRTAYLRQEFIDGLVLTRTLKEELYSSFEEEEALLRKIAACEEEVGNTTDNPEKMEQVLNKLQELQDEAISKGVYALESRVEKVMGAMGFGPDDASSLVSTFSGGWKMRIGLAKILLKEPNILLLDEPTNHLDLDSVFWLEDFLQKQNVPMVIVSHDREFLDRVCTKIVDVEDGVTVTYQGNYSKFIEQRRVRLELWREKYEKQKRYVQEEEKWIKKAKADVNMAQQTRSREIALEKFKNSEDWVEQPPKDKKFRFRFPPAPRCGNSVIEVSKLSHGYGTGKYQTLFKDVDIQVNRGDRVGFVGPNGSGSYSFKISEKMEKKYNVIFTLYSFTNKQERQQ